MKIYWYWLLSFATLYAPASLAEVITDGSLGGDAHSVSGPNYSIAQSLGKTNGPNLFHSFAQFNINKSEVANFQTTPAINNIFARVTGGGISTIDGGVLINGKQDNSGHWSSGLHAVDLWLINPAGWIIGKEASIDVNGTLHVTSANGIGFNDGTTFLADSHNKSELTFVAPVDYQFKTGYQATIVIDQTSIAMQPQKDFAVMGGDIKIQDAHISAPGGQILLASNSGAGRWQENVQGLQQLSGQQGTISVTQSNPPSPLNPNLTVSKVVIGNETAHVGGGQIALTAQQINLTNTEISAIAQDEQRGGNVKLSADTISMNKSRIDTDAVGSQDAGQIAIAGKQLIMTGDDNIGSAISANSESASTGKSGDIVLSLPGGKLQMDASSISSVLNGDGAGGTISVTAKTVDMAKQSSISTSTFSNGDAGKIFLTADSLRMLNRSSIASDAELGHGNAGNMAISSRFINLDNSEILSFASEKSFGQAGNLTITNANTVTGTKWDATLMLNHSQISTSVNNPLGNGNGGNITANSGTLIMKGGFIQANSLRQDPLTKGGIVKVNARESLSSNGNLLLGGDLQEFTFTSRANVIQAVAPEGLSTQVEVSAVELYIAGQLAKVSADFANYHLIANDPCSVARGAKLSSLIQISHGGLPPNATDPASFTLTRYLTHLSNEQRSRLDAITPQLAVNQAVDTCVSVP